MAENDQLPDDQDDQDPIDELARAFAEKRGFTQQKPLPVDLPIAHIDYQSPLARAYAEPALTGCYDEMIKAKEGSRNHILNGVSYRLGRIVGAGLTTEDQVRKLIIPAARSTGMPAVEIERTFQSGFTSGVKNPVQVAFRPQAGYIDVEEVSAEELLSYDQFWNSEQLDQLRRISEARGVNPYAVLSITIMKVLAHAPWWYYLPPIVGSPMPVGLWVVLTGGSSSGKSSAAKVGKDAIMITYDGSSDVEHGRVKTSYIECLPIATGQGMARHYRTLIPKTRDQEAHLKYLARSLIFDCPEISALAAHANQQGSTLISAIKLAFDGHSLKNAYADKEKAAGPEEMGYIACGWVGAQPEIAGPLFKDQEGGLPQRMLWSKVKINHVPRSEAPDPVEVDLPLDWRYFDDLEAYHEPSIISIPNDIQEWIWNTLMSMRTNDEDDLDGHSILIRERLAYGIAILHGRTEGFTHWDWEKAGWFIDHVSKPARDFVLASLAKAEKKKAMARGQAAGELEASKQRYLESITETKEDQLVARILFYLDSNPDLDHWYTTRDIMQRMGRDKGIVSELLPELVDQGLLETQKGNRANQLTYRRIRG